MKLTMSTLLSFGMFLPGCYAIGDGLSESTDVNTDGRVVGSINGIVRDEVTQSPLEGVTVSWARFNTTVSAVTDSNGVFTATALPQGSYDLVFRVPETEEDVAAYADAKMRITVPSLQDIGIVDQPTNAPFEHTIDAIVPIYPLTAGVDGSILATLEEVSFGAPETGVLAAGAQIVVDVLPSQADYWIISDQYSVTADSDGTFTISGLPATPSASVLVLPFEAGGYSYASENVVTQLSSWGQTSLGNIYLYNSATPPVIVTNNFIDSDEFLVSDALSLEFSKLFDAASLDVVLTGPSGEEAIASAWNGSTLTITPALSLSVAAAYELSVEGTTVDGYLYNEKFSFETEGGIELSASNVLDLTGLPVTDYDITADLTMSFSRDVDDSSADTFFELTEDGFSVYLSATVAGADVTLEPMFNLEPGIDYVLNYSVQSVIHGDIMSDSISFRTETDAVLPGTVSGFEYVSPVDVDYDTTSVTLRWDSVIGADEYHIYARDNLSNTSEVLIKSVKHQDFWTYHEQSLTFPSQFDVFSSDSLQTPFASGTEISLNIAAANSIGEGPLLAPSKEVDVEDEVRPEVVSYSVVGSTDNSSGTAPMEVLLTFQASEYIENVAATFSPANCFSCSILLVGLNKEGDGGEITIAIGVGDELDTDEVEVDFDDTSGNSVITDTYQF